MNDWIEFDDVDFSSINDKGQYEVAWSDSRVSVCHGFDIPRFNVLAIRVYIPTPYIAPIDPGEGWRLLGEDEIIEEGDEYNDLYGWCKSVDSGKSKNMLYAYRRRIEPTYRPFASAEEYKPHRDRWLVDKTHGDVVRLMSYQENSNWKSYFERYVFEDTGAPFGVEVEAAE